MSLQYKPDWDEVRTAFDAWWRRERTRPLVQVPAPRPGATHYIDMWAFLRHREDPARAMAELERAFAETHFAGAAYPNVWLNLGPGVLAAYNTGYLKFNAVEQTAWFETPMDWEAVERLAFREDGEWWNYTLEIARLAAQGNDGKYLIGTTDIGGILDVLASYRGPQPLLMDLLLAPERVDAMRAMIMEQWHRVYDRLDAILRTAQEGTSAWMGLWCPQRWYPLQCDFSAMISPDQFERFVAPDLIEQCRRLDRSIYHWDGPGQLPHLDCLLEIEELDGIQWVPGAGAPACEHPEWYPIYERILDSGKLLVLQQWDGPDGPREVLRRFPSGAICVTIHTADERAADRLVEELESVS